MTSAVSRRRALSGAAGVGLSLPVLAACGSDTGGGAASDPSTPSSAPPSDPSSTSAGTPSASETPTQSAGGAETDGLVAAADVPVGGGVVLTDPQVVVTQPTDGEFKAFTSICTHTGCPVSEVTTTIDCPCHGSQFDITTGDVVAGPAPTALEAMAIVVTDGQVVLA